MIMKKNFGKIMVLGVALAVLASCSKKDDLSTPLVGLGGDTWAKGPLDEWLSTNYTTPYNIEVKYKWDRSELGEIEKDVVPVKEDKVIPVMDAIKKVWIEPYVAVKGEAFFKKYAQKQFFLVGSPSYNSNGTMTLGTAEGGRKIVLMVLNQFDIKNKPEVRRMLHTIHHEFGHILNQNIAVTSDYQRITPGDYTATWFNFDDSEAQALGFITSYSRSNKDDDFVEMLASMLVDGQARMNDVVNNQFIMAGNFIKRDGRGIYERNNDSRSKLTRKQAIVIAYLKDAYGIELSQLQVKTQEAIEKLYPTPDLTSVIAFDKELNSININPQKLTGLSPKFLTAFNAGNTGLLNMGYYLDNISLTLVATNKIVLSVNLMDPKAALGQGFLANFMLDATTVAGVTTLSNPVAMNGNATFIQAAVTPLLTYFNNQKFNIRWVDDIVPQSKNLYGGFVKTTDATSYLFGTLQSF
jgi:substrate import-associated zinc metallohydrolase lipoprotein